MKIIGIIKHYSLLHGAVVGADNNLLKPLSGQGQKDFFSFGFSTLISTIKKDLKKCLNKQKIL